MAKLFSRKIEDFTCAHCGRKVVGNGYTNHCPACLYSLHVDDNPGDRACGCGGLMAPVHIAPKGEGYVILHRCETCGFERRNKTVPQDDFEAILGLMKALAQKGVL